MKWMVSPQIYCSIDKKLVMSIAPQINCSIDQQLACPYSPYRNIYKHEYGITHEVVFIFVESKNEQNGESLLNWMVTFDVSGQLLRLLPSLFSATSSVLLSGIFSAPSGGPRANQNELFGLGDAAYFGTNDEDEILLLLIESNSAMVMSADKQRLGEVFSFSGDNQDGESEWLRFAPPVGENVSTHPLDVCV